MPVCKYTKNWDASFHSSTSSQLRIPKKRTTPCFKGLILSFYYSKGSPCCRTSFVKNSSFSLRNYLLFPHFLYEIVSANTLLSIDCYLCETTKQWERFVWRQLNEIAKYNPLCWIFSLKTYLVRKRSLFYRHCATFFSVLRYFIKPSMLQAGAVSFSLFSKVFKARTKLDAMLEFFCFSFSWWCSLDFSGFQFPHLVSIRHSATFSSIVQVERYFVWVTLGIVLFWRCFPVTNSPRTAFASNQGPTSVCFQTKI